MNLSMLTLNKTAIKQYGIHDCYGVHKVVYSLFSKGSVGEDPIRDFLFREKEGDRFGRRILILSVRKPKLPEYGNLQIKEIPLSFFEKNIYKFSIRMNPVRRLSKSRRCEAITGGKEILSWFTGKSEQYGFSIIPETLELTGQGVQHFMKGTHRIVHNYADLTGVLKVKARDTFHSSIKTGLGRGKSFGFGLLELIPIQ